MDKEGRKQMNQLQVFENESGVFKVAAKLENGQVLFDVEQVAKSLGFVEFKAGKIYVRWRTVNGYLGKYVSQDVAKGDLIPEPLVYKLAFKASNSIAEQFQDWLAVEVIPSIRKHGAYATPETIENIINDPDFGIKLLTNLKEEKDKRLKAEQTIELQKPKVVYAEAVSVSKDTVLVKDLANVLNQKGIDIGTNRLFEWLRDNGYLCKKKGEMWNSPTQKSLDLKIMVTKHGLRTGSNGEIRKTRTPKITGKGQIYFINKFLNKQGVI